MKYTEVYVNLNLELKETFQMQCRYLKQNITFSGTKGTFEKNVNFFLFEIGLTNY